MTNYDELFEETAPEDSVFADKGALDPLAEPEAVLAREDQDGRLAAILHGVQAGALPTTGAIDGSPVALCASRKYTLVVPLERHESSGYQ